MGSYQSAAGRLTVKDTAIDGGSVASIGTSTTELVASNAARSEVFITNTHASQTLSLGLGVAAVAGEGIVLVPSQGVVIDTFTGTINAIASGASTTVAVAVV